MIFVGVFLGVMALSFFATLGARRYALRASIMDHPNERSLHTQATPRGGGIGIVASVAVATLVGFAYQLLPAVIAQIVSLAIAMAALGFWDDRASLSAKFRLRAQLVLALILLLVLKRAFGSIAWSEALGFVLPTVAVSIFILLFMLWMTNLFNFMDGSDGIAGVQALTVGLGLAALALIHHAPFAAGISFMVAGASAGFLILNWQPAKIFMGDVGSVFLGFLLAALVVWYALSDAAPFAAALLLQGAFVVDATVTLIRRLLRKKAPHIAHRSHAYQRMVQKGWTHGRVAALYGAINLIWLLPMSIVSAFLLNGTIGGVTFTGWGPWVALVIAWTPLVGLALWMRAGEDFKA